MAYCSHCPVSSSSNNNTQCEMKLVHLRMRRLTLTYDGVAAAVLSPSSSRFGRYKIIKLVRLRTICLCEYLVTSQTIGLWIAYESFCMMSTSNVAWMWYMTYCLPLQLVLFNELSLIVRVLLCLFLSWQATRKVVHCWTKCRLKVPWPQVPQESITYPTAAPAPWGVLYDVIW